MYETERHRGTVIWFNPTRGYGFIRPLSYKGEELFTHFRYIVQRGFKSLNKEDIVEFTIGRNDKGKCATEVKVLERKEV